MTLKKSFCDFLVFQTSETLLKEINLIVCVLEIILLTKVGGLIRIYFIGFTPSVKYNFIAYSLSMTSTNRSLFWSLVAGLWV